VCNLKLLIKAGEEALCTIKDGIAVEGGRIESILGGEIIKDN